MRGVSHQVLGRRAAQLPALPDAALDADAAWLPALTQYALAECAAQREQMGPLADRYLQPVPA